MTNKGKIGGVVGIAPALLGEHTAGCPPGLRCPRRGRLVLPEWFLAVREPGAGAGLRAPPDPLRPRPREPAPPGYVWPRRLCCSIGSPWDMERESHRSALLPAWSMVLRGTAWLLRRQ